MRSVGVLTIMPTDLPPVVTPSGLSAERQWYLFDSIQEYCPETCRDDVCLKNFRVTLAKELIGDCCSRKRIGRPTRNRANKIINVTFLEKILTNNTAANIATSKRNSDMIHPGIFKIAMSSSVI